MRKKVMRVYRTKYHLLGTILVIVVPFLFLLYFSRVSNIDTGVLFENLVLSVGRIIVAYIISAVLAWVLAVFFYRGKRADYALPVFDILQSFPTSATLPLAALIWGKTNSTVIFFLVLTMIWPILFSLISALKLVKHEWEESVEIGGITGWRYIKSFLIPVSFPALVTGSIIGIGEGWEALVATEIIIGIQSGLGHFFEQFATNTTLTALGVLGFLLLIFSVNKIIWLPLLERSHKMLEE
ncbi:MAG: ABC transporter permease subunit [Candidatus Pacebacteria bacterium]|nr:ABC transporter permease subunit [Candidatus Paceibacterota bacterium]